MYVKVYAPTTRGDDLERWRRYYAETDYRALTANTWRDPTFRLLQAIMPKDAPILEGGCGLSQIVLAMRRSGFNMVGLDYEKLSLATAKRFSPSLPLTIGDVTELPIRSESMGGLYLDGVIEHFENGPARVLAEARRILQPGGVLVIIVPALNLHRRLIARLSRTDFRLGQYRVNPRVDTTTTASAAPGWDFFFYLYAREQLELFLDQAGFDVTIARQNGFVRGMLDIKPVARWHAMFKRRSGEPGTAAATTDATVRQRGPEEEPPPESSLKKAYMSLLQDRLPVPCGRWLERFLLRVFGHTTLLVCHNRPA